MTNGFPFDDYNNLGDTVKKAKEAFGSADDSLGVSGLISDEFIREFTSFPSFAAFSKQPIFQRYEGFSDIPQDELDGFIAANTQFSDFQTFIKQATSDFARRQLGL